MIKPSEFKNGKTFYEVMAFPERAVDQRAYMQVMRITGRPFVSEYINSLFVKNSKEYQFSSLQGSYVTENSLNDMNIPENGYNFHRVFRTRKAAQRYMDRMMAGQLNAQERKKLRGYYTDMYESRFW